MDTNEDIKTLKREMTIIIKENKKLQSELKLKNESMSTLINQNFTQLESLQNKHENIVSSITQKYSENIKKMDNYHCVLKNSMHTKLKKHIASNYNLNNEQIKILTNHNQLLTGKINFLQNENSQLDSKIDKLVCDNKLIICDLNDKISLLDNQVRDLTAKNNNLSIEKNLLGEKLMQANNMCEKISLKNNESSSKITSLMMENDNLQTSLKIAQNELVNNIDIINNLTMDRDLARQNSQDFQNKYLLLFNDNIARQNNIDEKAIQILNLNSKISDLEKKYDLSQSLLVDTNTKMIELLNQNEKMQLDILSTNSTIKHLTDEKNIIISDKQLYFTEMENYKLKYKDLELAMLDKIKQIQESVVIEKEKYITEYGKKMTDVIETYNKTLSSIKSDTDVQITNQLKQIDGLTIYVKTLVDNQYLTLTEIEKFKLINEKLKIENTNIDQKMADIHSYYKKQIEEVKSINKRETDTLMETYMETIKKSQELNDMLQHKLNQSIDALSISKITLTNLKESNCNLEKQIQSQQTENMSGYEKFNQLRAENNSLREKLERAIELNNNFNHKEKQYEMQIEQLRAKYAHLITLTKKNVGH